MSEQWGESRWRIVPIVVDPPAQERIDAMSDFCQRQIGSTSETQLPNLRTHGLQRRGADGWSEAAEHCIVPRPSNQPRPKAVPEEVKLDVRILASTLSVPAVDDSGLRRMHFEVALCQSRLKCALDAFGFMFDTAVN